MRQRHSLRFRVAAAFAGFGALLGMLFAVSILVAAHDVSNRLMDQTLKEELNDYMSRRARNPNSLPPYTTGLRGYVAAIGTLAEGIPPEVQALPPGKHEIVLDGIPFRIAVADHNGERYTMLFSEERQRLREKRFLSYLVAVATIMTLLVAGGGFWLATRVIAPLTELARTVAEAPTDNPPQFTAVDKLPDEIRELTRSFDRYFTRISALVERERAFAADASHEFRTPLAVIQGAAEVLAEDVTLTEAQANRVARIERAAAEMSALTSALLLLASEEKRPVDEVCDCAKLVRNAVDHYQALASQRENSIDLAIEAPVGLYVEPAVFSIVADNLVRNAVTHTERGRVTVQLHADSLVISNTGISISADEISRVFQRYYRGAASSGSGIGLSLVKRICEREGWQIGLESPPSGGMCATLTFNV